MQLNWLDLVVMVLATYYAAVTLAKAEGLDAHGKSTSIRLKR